MLKVVGAPLEHHRPPGGNGGTAAGSWVVESASCESIFTYKTSGICS